MRRMANSAFVDRIHSMRISDHPKECSQCQSCDRILDEADVFIYDTPISHAGNMWGDVCFECMVNYGAPGTGFKHRRS